MNKRAEYKGYFYEIVPDDSPTSPREWDNLGHMVFTPQRHYTFGDEQLNQEEIMEIVNRKDVISLPIFIYDHSGISLSTKRTYPFDDPWDSAHIGYIYVTLDSVRKEMGRPKPRKDNINPDVKAIKHITKADREHAIKILESEVAEYSAYVNGDVFGYIVTDQDGDALDSCWGFYGLAGYENAEKEARGFIDWRVEQDSRDKVEANREEIGELVGA